MSEKMISADDARRLKFRLNECMGELEDDGFDRTMIASAMLGISAGVIVVHNGRSSFYSALGAIDAAIDEEASA